MKMILLSYILKHNDFYWADYTIVPSSEMSGSVGMFVYMCTLPWPDHSRLRSETFII